MLEIFFSQTPPIIPANEVLNANLNKILYEQGKIITDGCCGEIFRRQYFFKLMLNGKNTLLNFNSNKLPWIENP